MSDENEKKSSEPSEEVSRRTFLRLSALAGAGAPLAGMLGASAASAASTGESPVPLTDAAVALEEATIAQLQAAMTRGGLTSLALVNMYIERITAVDEKGPGLNAVLEVNPDARRIARALDRERRN